MTEGERRIMTLDLQAFGSGIGLVMTGWICGLVVSYVFSLIGILPNISKKG